MACRPSRTASSTSSSGALAPSRKLYAECACNAAYATDERIGRPSFGGWYAIRLRDQGASSAGVHTVGVPERRGLPESTRSISDQPGGPLLKPTDSLYRIYVRIAWRVFASASSEPLHSNFAKRGYAETYCYMPGGRITHPTAPRDVWPSAPDHKDTRRIRMWWT